MAKKIFVDLTDLIANSLWHGAITGIQRVQLNVALALLQTQNAIPFSVYEGRWLDLSEDIRNTAGDSSQFLARVALRFPHTTKNIARFRSNRRLYFLYRVLHRGLRVWWDVQANRMIQVQIAPQDRLVVLGAYWQISSLVLLYRRASERGAVLIAYCHDLFHMLNSAQPGIKSGAALQQQKFLSLPSHLLVNSNHTRAELLRVVQMGLLPPLQHAPVTVPLAQEFAGFARNGIAPQRAERLTNLIGQRPYVLMVGSYEPHKNHAAAIRVWNRVSQSRGGVLPVLVFAGKGNTEIQNTLRDCGNAIVWIDRPSDEELFALYSHCLFTLFPSLREGWGLPVGESLWLGKVCACSNTTSLPEVGSDLCCYFDPNNDSDIEASVTALLAPPFRQQKEATIKAAELRTWSQVYREIAAAIANGSQ